MLNIDILLAILILILIVLIPIVICVVLRLGIDKNELKLFETIKNKAPKEADLNTNLPPEKKIELEKIKLILTVFTVITTIIAALITYKNYLVMADKDRKESLDKQFIELVQKVSSSNQDEKEIAIITFPRFALHEFSQYQKNLSLKKQYNTYDDFIQDFSQKYPYVTESTTIILNELKKIAIKKAEEKCKKNKSSNDCSELKDIYPYFTAPFNINIYSSTIINSLNLITQETIQENIRIKDNKLFGKKISALDLRKRNFWGVCLKNANLEGMNGQNTNLSFSNISAANLNYAYLKNIELIDANCRFAKFQNTYLVASLAKGADFTGANFRNADLSESILIGVNFANAYVANAKFNNTLIYKANFLGAKFKFSSKNIDLLLKEDIITPIDVANFKPVRCEISKKCTPESKFLPDFNGAIVDIDNYDKIDFLNKNYKYVELNKNNILSKNYKYSIKNYLINELNSGEKMGQLEALKN